MTMRKIALVLLNLFSLPNAPCLAFQSPTTIAPDDLFRSPSGLSLTRLGSSDGVVPCDVVSRRSILSAGSAAALTLFTSIPFPSFAVVGGAAQSAARVESWPGIESLEPLYEFKLSVDAVVAGVQDPASWPFIKKRLDAFFGGFIINEKNYFMGVGIQYMNEMQYDKGELPNYVLLDKETRFEALENTMKNLESLKSVLADSGNVDARTVGDLAKSSQRSLQVFFDLIPDQDVKAVEELFVHVKKADINGDGRLSNDEIVFLSPVEQEIWKRRVEKY